MGSLLNIYPAPRTQISRSNTRSLKSPQDQPIITPKPQIAFKPSQSAYTQRSCKAAVKMSNETPTGPGAGGAAYQAEPAKVEERRNVAASVFQINDAVYLNTGGENKLPLFIAGPPKEDDQSEDNADLKCSFQLKHDKETTTPERPAILYKNGEYFYEGEGQDEFSHSSR